MTILQIDSMKKPVRFVLAAIAFTVIAFVIHTVCSMLTMSYYTDPNYFPVWSKLMMPTAGPPPASFTYYSITFDFIIGLIFSYIYLFFKGCIPGKTLVNKGVFYGLVLFLVAGVPFFLTNYLLINLPIGLLVSWLFVDGLLTYVIGGIAIAWLNK